MEGNFVPIFGNSIVGVNPFTDERCIGIFPPRQGGVTIHRQEYIHTEFLAPPIIQGVREESGLWRVPLNNDTNSDGDLF